MLDWKKDVAPDKYFYCRDGKVFRNIDDLLNALSDKNLQQEEGMLRFHLQNGSNDFANWIKGVFMMDELAEKIRPIKEPEKFLAELEEYRKNHDENADEISKEKKENDRKEREIDEKDIERVKALQTEEERLKKHIAELSEESDFLFDKVKKMRMRSYMNKKSMKEKIAELYSDYEDLNAKISEWRRKGYDLLIPALKLKNLRPKLKFLEVSESKTDYEKVVSLIQDILHDIKEASEKEPLDIKSEIMEAAGLAKPKAEE